MNQKEKRMIDILRKNRPQLKNPEALRREIENRISEMNSVNRSGSLRFYWIKVAATLLLLIGIGNYGYQEWTIRTAVLGLKIHKKVTVEDNLTYSSCKDEIQEMIGKLRYSPFYRRGEDRVYFFSLADVAYLEQVNSPYLGDVKAFMKVLENFYPDEYFMLMDKGETILPVKKLSKDDRVCELFKR